MRATERTQHALSSDNDLLGLFLNGEGTDQRRNFFRRLPLRELTETLLSSPYTCVNNLQEQLARTRVEDEDSPVDWLSCQVTLEGLVTKEVW